MTLDASYVFRAGPFFSGLFGGIGGYRISPHSISPVLDTVTEPEETVFGWNVGVDGDLHLYRGLSAVGRVTFHGILAENRVGHDVVRPCTGSIARDDRARVIPSCGPEA